MNHKWIDNTNLFACPICGRQMKVFQSGIVCEKKHCFDISRKGYVNLIHNSPTKIYNADLFKSRSFIYECGFYDQVMAGLDALAHKYLPIVKGSVIVDAGCGDGTYLNQLCCGTGIIKIGFDISKDAIMEACRRSDEIMWFVADLAYIPLKDHCADVLFNIFTPANYSSFQRVLKKNGILIKVVPGSEYLSELRAAAGRSIRNERYDEDRVICHLEKHLQILEIMHINYKVSVNTEQVHRWIKMTPMLANVSPDDKLLSKIHQITIDVNICVCRKVCN